MAGRSALLGVAFAFVLVVLGDQVDEGRIGFEPTGTLCMHLLPASDHPRGRLAVTLFRLATVHTDEAVEQYARNGDDYDDANDNGDDVFGWDSGGHGYSLVNR